MFLKLFPLLFDPFLILLHDFRNHDVVIFRMNQLIVMNRKWQNVVLHQIVSILNFILFVELYPEPLSSLKRTDDSCLFDLFAV